MLFSIANQNPHKLAYWQQKYKKLSYKVQDTGPKVSRSTHKVQGTDYKADTFLFRQPH